MFRNLLTSALAISLTAILAVGLVGCDDSDEVSQTNDGETVATIGNAPSTPPQYMMDQLYGIDPDATNIRTEPFREGGKIAGYVFNYDTQTIQGKRLKFRLNR